MWKDRKKVIMGAFDIVEWEYNNVLDIVVEAYLEYGGSVDVTISPKNKDLSDEEYWDVFLKAGEELGLTTSTSDTKEDQADDIYYQLRQIVKALYNSNNAIGFAIVNNNLVREK